MLQIIIANRLTDGLIVFRDAQGAWTTSLAAASRLTSKDEIAAALEGGRLDMAANLIVEAEAIEVHEEAGKLVPVALRDRIRVSGPTILQAKRQAATPAGSEQTDVSI